MRGGTAFHIVGTMGAEVETFLRIRLLFLECFTLPRPSSVRAAPCQLPRGGSFCTGLWGGEFIGTPQGSSQNLPHRGRGTARRRWMRGGTALYIVGTMGAEVETFLWIRLQFLKYFRLPRGPHQSGLRPASFPGGEAFVPWFQVLGFIGNSSVLSGAERHIGRSLRFRW